MFLSVPVFVQTRGWFYTLTVLGAALFDKPAFKNLIVNGLVLASDGKKMSKRLKNYPGESDDTSIRRCLSGVVRSFRSLFAYACVAFSLSTMVDIKRGDLLVFS